MMYRKSVSLLALGLVLAIAGGVHAQTVEGKVIFEYWFGGGINNDLDTLKAHPDYPDNPHDGELRDMLDRPDWSGMDYWGARGRAYLTPAADGDYTFWVAADDDCELYLSTDEEPANAVLIAQVEGWCNYQDYAGTSGSRGENSISDPVTLVAGQRYYVEMSFSDGTGGGHGSIAWSGADIGPDPVTIPSDVLSMDASWIPTFLYQAKNPDPADGTLDITAPLFKWEAGMDAVMHEVYFGTSPDLGPADFKGSMPVTLYFHVEPLEPGATYYWRIDEVDAVGAKTEGEVWSFTVTPLEAHLPSPYDGALWRKIDIGLSWAAGQGAVSHVVYAGTDEAAVAAGDGSALLGETPETSFSVTDIGIEALEPDTRYYWRIDEVDGGGNVVAGPVWTFTTINPKAGAVAEYWANMDLDGDPDVVTVVPEINFDWGSGGTPGENSPDPCIPVDRFSCRWTAQLNVPVTGTYTLYEASDDGARMRLNGELVAEGWWDRGTTEDTTGPLELVAGETYLLEMEQYENGGGATAFLRWEGPGIPKEIIPQGALQIPKVAFAPGPADDAVYVAQASGLDLTWSPGEGAVAYDIYLGDSEEAVAAGDPSTYRGQQTEITHYPGLLDSGATYYWRIDAIGADGTVMPGSVWRFTTTNFVVVDDFEPYAPALGPPIYEVWIDGRDDPDNGAIVRIEEALAFIGTQSMAVDYDNTGGVLRSEVTRTFDEPNDWTREGAEYLFLYVRGQAGNAADQFYVIVQDSAGNAAPFDHPDPEVLATEEWTPWWIPLDEVAGEDVNIRAVERVIIGVRDPDAPLPGHDEVLLASQAAGGAGTAYVGLIVTAGTNYGVLRGYVYNVYPTRVSNPQFHLSPIDFPEHIMSDGSYVILLIQDDYDVTVSAPGLFCKWPSVPCNAVDNKKDFDFAFCP